MLPTSTIRENKWRSLTVDNYWTVFAYFAKADLLKCRGSAGVSPAYMDGYEMITPVFWRIVARRWLAADAILVH